jgi:hypothetical protein
VAEPQMVLGGCAIRNSIEGLQSRQENGRVVGIQVREEERAKGIHG